MTVLEKRQFERFYDQDSAAVFADLEFRRCSFESCAISMARTPALRSTVRNVRLLGCEQRASSVHAAIVEDVLVDGAKTHTLVQTWAAVFKHVTFRGRVGRWMFNHLVSPQATAASPEQRAFDAANADFYRGVDWALDLSEADFDDCDIRGIPTHLIRRDPATQIVITRAKALAGAWRALDLTRTHWATSIEFFLEQGHQDVVLVAPRRGPKSAALREGLKVLRDAGVAEPE